MAEAQYVGLHYSKGDIRNLRPAVRFKLEVIRCGFPESGGNGKEGKCEWFLFSKLDLKSSLN